MLLSALDIQRQFPRPAFERGREYWQQGRVREAREVDHNASERVFQGLVKGGRSADYTVEIRLNDNGRVLQESCTCPLQMSCKHVVATMLQQCFGDPVNNQSAAPGSPAAHASYNKFLDELRAAAQSPKSATKTADTAPWKLIVKCKFTGSPRDHWQKISLQPWQAVIEGSFWQPKQMLQVSELSLDERSALSANTKSILNILQVLQKNERSEGGWLSLYDESGLAVFRDALEGGYLLLDDNSSVALGRGDVRIVPLHYAVDESGNQRLAWICPAPARR
jgi:hypothetical protein